MGPPRLVDRQAAEIATEAEVVATRINRSDNHVFRSGDCRVTSRAITADLLPRKPG
jgi:hypothetical protein